MWWHYLLFIFVCEWVGVLFTPYSFTLGAIPGGSLILKGDLRFPLVSTHTPPQPLGQGFGNKTFVLINIGIPWQVPPPPHVEGIFSGMIREEGETTTGRLHASIRGPYFSGETGMDFLWGLFSWVGFLHLYLYQTLIYAKGLVYMRNVPSHFVYKH